MDLDSKMMQDAGARRVKEEYQKRLQAREKLPVWERLREIMTAVENHQVVLVCGDPGSGKSTQLVQAIMDRVVERGKGSTFRAICAQPTELGTIAAAEKVAQDLCEPCGGVDSPVGYQTSQHRQLPRERGSILFCTTDVLARHLVADPKLENISHLLLDEVHDRDLQMDFFLAVLQPILKWCGSRVKVILMTTKISDVSKIIEYFNPCPFHLVISSMRPQVTIQYIDDILEKTGFIIRPKTKKRQLDGNEQVDELDEEYKRMMAPHIHYITKVVRRLPDVVTSLQSRESEESPLALILCLLEYICSSPKCGAILMFLPGLTEVKEIREKILGVAKFRDRKYYEILDTSLPTESQKIFVTQPLLKWKIILSTEVAETSISIDDVAYVIDCGRNRKEFFDPKTNTIVVKFDWISHANAEQRLLRAGRPGRSLDGICYRMYSKTRKSTFAKHQVPDVQRMPLDECILRSKFLSRQEKYLHFGNAATFCKTMLEPPDVESVKFNVESLVKMGALHSSEQLTPLGLNLIEIPTDPRTAKLIFLGALFGCIEPLLNIAAVLWTRIPPFLGTPQLKKEIHARMRVLNEGKRSDHLLFARVTKEFRAIIASDPTAAESVSAAKNYCKLNFLDFNSMVSLKNAADQLSQNLYDAGFLATPALTDPGSNVNSTNERLIRAVLCAGLFPNIANVHYQQGPGDGGAQQQPPIPSLTTLDGDQVVIHPGSVNSRSTELESNWLCYGTKVKTSRLFLEECSEVSRSALLFSIGIGPEKLGPIVTGGLLQVKVATPITLPTDQLTLHLLERLRIEFNHLLTRRASDPVPTDWAETDPDSGLLREIIAFVFADGQPQPPVHDVDSG